MKKRLKVVKISIKKFILWLYHLWSICWLPIILSLIFVAQNYYFILWLNIPVELYLVRRTIVTISLGLLIFGPFLFLNKRIKYFYLFLSSSLITLIFISQFLYYSYSGGFLQASAFLYISEGTTTLGTVKNLLSYGLLFFVLGPLIIVITWIFTHQNVIVEKIFNRKEKILTGIFILIFVIAGYGYLLGREYVVAGNISSVYKFDKIYDVNALVTKVGIINFSLGDALTRILSSEKVTTDDINLVKNFQEQNLNIQKATTTNFGMLKDRNLILIQVESLENAIINQIIEGEEVTPNLNKLAKEGLYFTNFYAPIGPGTTADTEFMTLNSLYSLPDTVAFIKYAYNNYTALPKLLKNNGYGTYALHGDLPSFWNRANIYPQLGYEKWFGKEDYIIDRKIGVYGLGDKNFFEQSIPKLESFPQPFMATLITETSHTPFELPSDLITIDVWDADNLDWLQINYAQSIHYTDLSIGVFIEQLKTTDIYDNSLILIYGDHSSYTNISEALKFNNSIFPELQTTEVPLIIIAPNSNLQGIKNTPSTLLDIYPTVANLLGITTSPNIFGHDIINDKDTVAISRNLISGTINTIITNKLAYKTAKDGVFEHGTCLDTESKKILIVETCRALYTEKENEVKISDLMIKGDLINSQ